MHGMALVFTLQALIHQTVFGRLFNVHCKLYTVNCKLYTVLCRLYALHRLLYTIHFRLYIVPCIERLIPECMPFLTFHGGKNVTFQQEQDQEPFLLLLQLLFQQNLKYMYNQDIYISVTLWTKRAYVREFRRK